MNYDEMSAGREMDTLIAEKVMGWERETDPKELARLDQYRIPEELDVVWWKRSHGWAIDPRPYSTDIGAAWEIIEEFKRRNWEWFLESDPGVYRMSVDIAPPTSQHCQWIDDVTADTASLTICRAALKAIANK